MLKSSSKVLYNMVNMQNSRVVLQPVNLVLHGNQYLRDLSSNNNTNDIAKRTLESMNLSFNEPNDLNNNKIINAKDWVHNLHDMGMSNLSLSRSIKNNNNSKSKSSSSSSSSSSGNSNNNSNSNSLLSSTLYSTSLPNNGVESEFVIVSSTTDIDNSNSNNNNIQAWQFAKNEQNETLPKLSHQINNSKQQLEEYLIWKKIMLGEIRIRIRDSLEALRDFTLLNFNKMDLSPIEKQNFLNGLTQAESFISMDVMVTTTKDMDKLYDYLNLPREYAKNSQSKVALQILNAALSAYIFDSSTKIIDPKLNEDFKNLTKELYESVLDSIICSTNNFDSV